jgi:hypothetical protein
MSLKMSSRRPVNVGISFFTIDGILSITVTANSIG